MTDDGAGKVKNLGWAVTFAGLGINLALGVLYTALTGRSINYYSR